MLLPKCKAFVSKNSKFMNDQEARSILSSSEIKTP